MLRETRLGRVLKAAVDGGQIGEPVFLNLVCLGAADATDAIVADLLELSVWLLAEAPVTVQARTRVDGPVRHRGVTLRFPRDRVAIVELSSGGSADPFERVLVLGTTGRLMFDSAEAAVLQLPADRRVLPVGGLVWDDPPRPAVEPDPAALALVRAAVVAAELDQPVSLLDGELDRA